ncbi:MAG TPA: glycosyltransferase [Opitutaceae bacterium]
MPAKPNSVVYLRPDTLGDLVLFGPSLRLFMEAWPKARHVVVVRDGYESIAPLFPAGIEWKVARLNPFSQRPSECAAGLKTLLADLAAAKPDLILAPTLSRTWLEVAVAAHFKGVRSVALGSGKVDPIFETSLRIDLGIDAASAFAETLPAAEGERDVENQHRLAEHLIGRKLDRQLPSISVPDAQAKAARAILEKHGLPAGKWAAVFAGGVANVKVKAWPTARLGEIAAWIGKTKGMPVLVLGAEAESGLADEVAAAAAKAGPRPPIWLGRSGEVPLLAAILADSAFYVGIDTGAMHIAGAAGKPVAAVFGGGHWPRFRPSARQAVAVVQPLPCFGCNWDCIFGDGPCVKAIPAKDVMAAVDKLLSAGTAAINEVIESKPLPAEAIALIAAAAPGLRSLRKDRLERQHKIEELKAETDFKDTEITALKAAAEDRKREMESIKAELEQECADKDAEIAELKAETNTKDVEIAALKAAAEDRKREMESIKAELEQECADKDAEIAELKAEANTKDSEIDALKVSCDEREAIVIRLDAGLKAHIAAAAARDQQLAAIQADREALSKRLDLLSTLPADAETWAQNMRHKDVHIANIEAIVRNREEEIALLRQSIENYSSGYASTEQAKHFGRLLAEKEAVIHELHKTCLARADVIADLAAGPTGPAAGLRRLWTALRAWWRESFSRGASGWLFRTVVDGYWMQIGVLSQYAPRPIRWDPRVRSGSLAGSDLPKMGIVTPSFEQPAFVESTIVNILNQGYPKLLYVVQDGGSRDSTPEIIARHAKSLRHWASEPDKGQADAIRKGFSHIVGDLGPTDVMAWFNSDDLVAPRALSFVGSYFAAHPDVDVVYGHRIIIDEADREIGRWVMPSHERESLEWIDYVPQETLYWRKRAWDLAGGIDPSFQFALDWDLLARFQSAGCSIVRIPYFLGCFRVHSQQKTSQVIHTTGAQEMARIRQRFHGPERDDAKVIERKARRIRFRGAVASRLLAAGIRY